MTVEHTNDMEPTSTTVASVPKKTKSSTSKPKKTPTSSKEAFSSATAEVKKTAIKRPRKPAISSKVQEVLEESLTSDIPRKPAISSKVQEVLEESLTSDIPLEKEEASAKAKVSRVKKPAQRKIQVKSKGAGVAKVTKNVELSEDTTDFPPTEIASTNSDAATEGAQDSVASAKKTARRGRPKKNIAVIASEQSPAQELQTSQAEEGNEQEVSSLETKQGKTHKPRRVPKAKTSQQENASEIALPPIQQGIVEETSSLSVEDSHEASEQIEEHISKSRRGRRGGRGKRGKKRAVTLPTQEQATDDTLQEQEDGALQSKALVAANPNKSTRTARMAAAKKAVESKSRKMFISMVQGEQVEVALVESGIIHEYYLEMLHQVKTKGNIYKGVVNNIDANLQAAFISYGAQKNGFLQIDEIHPEYYQSHHEFVKGKKFPPIQKIIKPGQEILIQVVKEPTGNKGAFLTTWLSLPGRFLVLTPGQEQIGVSRKVDNDEERARLRDLMTGIDPGAGLGVIVRTASAGTTKTTLKSDLQYLKRVWREIRKRGVSESAPALLYRESNLAERAIRDYLTDDVVEVWVDSSEGAEILREMVSLLFPRKKELVRIHADVRQTLWERFNMQRQLEQIYAREVVLPSGGRLVFDQTEALMAIDINSGKISGKGNFESMALRTNIEAAEAIARHLKLRDIGGQVVIDFIEMRDKNHVREVEKTLRNAMKNDRARHDVARMSSFGLLEIVRQRTGSSALAITMEPCPHCRGTGQRRNLEWQALQALGEIERKGRSAQSGKFSYVIASKELAFYLLNHKRQRIAELEEQLKISIEISMQ